MKSFRYFPLIATIIAGILNITTQAKVVEIAESPYAQNAPQELIELIEPIAHSWNFEKPYAIIVPTKAGIQINPWNLFTYVDIDPLTRNHYLLINKDWFFQLPQTQQRFLLERNFARIIHGKLPWSISYLPYIFGIISILLMVIFVLLLRKIAILRKQTVIIAIVVAIGITGVLEIAILDKIQAKVRFVLGKRYDKYLHEIVIKKTGDRQAAIDAFEAMHKKISEEITNGQAFFIPNATVFKTCAEQLQTN